MRSPPSGGGSVFSGGGFGLSGGGGSVPPPPPEKVADILCGEVTSLNVNVVTAPTFAPSTTTAATT